VFVGELRRSETCLCIASRALVGDAGKTDESEFPAGCCWKRGGLCFTVVDRDRQLSQVTASYTESDLVKV
jgi:hypothetical protein